MSHADQNNNSSSVPVRTTIYVVRHGQTDWNKERRIQGRTDIPLNDHGKSEVSNLATHLLEKRLDACYSSPLTRAMETATIITSLRNLAVAIDERLLEKHYGSWEGKLKQEFDAGEDHEKQDVESDLLVQDRVFSFLEELTQKHLGQTILVIAHAGVMRTIVAKLSMDAIAIPNCALLTLHNHSGSWVLA